MKVWPVRAISDEAEVRREGALADLRFRALIGRKAWDALPEAVQRRFSKRLGGISVTLYAGEVVDIRYSALGWLFAQAMRIIGAPLPICRDVGVPAIVSVSEDHASGGQVWSRLYGRRDGFPQVIHSAKRFAGPTGLEEYIGHGIGMALKVIPVDEGLQFVSDHYFVQAGAWRLRIPRWLEPGRTIVEHRDLGSGRFLFGLELRHPSFGVLISQRALFRDA